MSGRRREGETCDGKKGSLFNPDDALNFSQQ